MKSIMQYSGRWWRLLYSFLIIALFVSDGWGRENPFKPLIDSTVLPITSNRVPQKPLFEGVRILLPNDARVLQSVVVRYQSLDGSIQQKEVSIDKRIDWHHPLWIHPGSTMRHSGTKRKLFRPFPFLTVVLEPSRILLRTKDPKLRHFHLKPPFTIVVDFKRDASFLTKHLSSKIAPITAIDIGNHHGFYRIAIRFDASYRYHIQKRHDGYAIVIDE